MNIASLLAAATRTFGNRPAISIGSTAVCNYAELSERSARIAAGLRSWPGMKRGDRIALAMTNCPAYIEIMWACWIAGLCVVPINSKLHPKEFEFIFENTGARIAFITDNLLKSISPLEKKISTLEKVICVETVGYDQLLSYTTLDLQDVDDQDPAWLFYTSGTTGRPKGAILTHQNLRTMAMRYYADLDQLSDKDCLIHCAPLSHASGLYSIPHIAKASHQIIPESRGFDPAEMFDLIGTYPRVSFFCAPTMMTRLTNFVGRSEPRIENIRTIFYGGAPTYLEDLKKSIALFGPRLTQLYGQGEMPNTICGLSKEMHGDTDHPDYEYRLSTVGIPRTGVEVRVVDDDDHDVPYGEVGEVIARSDQCMAGYWNNSEATAATLRGGWLHTGDLGTFDENGFLTIKDRSKDMIISGGTNIYPREVEEALLKHPGLLECSVIGRRHPDWGEEVVAFVVPRPSVKVREEELELYCLENIARFKRPRAYFFLDSLPKSAYGKILKTELRNFLNSDDAQ